MKLLSMASIVASAFPVILHAQTIDGPSSPASAASQDMHEVTPASVAGGAIKQDMPMTKEVTSSQAMASSQEGYTDVANKQAGVTPQNSVGAAVPAFAIRGIKLNSQANFRLDGGVAITAVQSLPTENKERIETLKGANALAFGIASPAGIINMIPKRAGGHDTTSLIVNGNSFGQLMGHVDVGRRFGEEKQVGVRVNLSKARVRPGIHDLDGTADFAGVGVDWRATRDLTLQADFEYYSRDIANQPQIALLAPVNGVIVVPQPPDPRNNLLGTDGNWSRYHPVSRNVQLRADYTFSDTWKLLLQVGQSDARRLRSAVRLANYDPVTGADALLDETRQTNKNLNKSLRAELIGDVTLGGIGNQVTVGVSRAERESESAIARLKFAQKQNIYDPVVILQPAERPLVPNKDQNSKDDAVYAYDTIGLTPKVKLLAGMRVTKNTDVVEGQPDEVTYTKSPTLGIMYDIGPSTMLYASSMTGLEAGPVAPTTAVNNGVVLGPTISKQKEIGIRDNSLPGLMLNVAYFDIVRANPIIDPVTNIYRYNGNLSYKGVEANVTYRFLRQWSLNAAVQGLNAVQLLDGKQPENTPKWSANLSLGYRAPWLPGLSLRAGASAISRRAVDPKYQGFIPGYTLFSAGANYATRIGGKSVSFLLGVDNLANKRYWNSVNTGILGVGMDRSVRFGMKVDL